MNFRQLRFFGLFQAFQQFCPLTVGSEDKVQHRNRHIADFLFNKDNIIPARKKHVSGFGFQFAFQDPEQSGFAAAVGSDQADFLAIGNMSGSMFQQDFAAKAHGYVIYINHAGVNSILRNRCKPPF